MLLKTILAAIYAPFAFLPLYFFNYVLVASYGINWIGSIFLFLTVLAFSCISLIVFGGLLKSNQLKVTEELHGVIVRINNLVIIGFTSFSFVFLWDKNLIGSLVSSAIGGFIALATYMAAGILEGRIKGLKEIEAEKT